MNGEMLETFQDLEGDKVSIFTVLILWMARSVAAAIRQEIN